MKKSQKKAIAIGAGVAALTAAAATGAYFLTGKKGVQNRKKIAQWANQAKKEVTTEFKKAEKMSRGAYDAAVDTVAKRYKNLKKLDASELAGLAKELKGHWDSINKGMSTSAAKRPRKAAKKAVRKAAKKAAKKPAKKKARR